MNQKNRGGWIVAVVLLAFVLLGAWNSEAQPTPRALDYPPLDPAHPVVGTLESSPAHIDATNQAGARGVVVGISWDRFEPQEGVFAPAYEKTLRKEIDAFRAGGKLIVIDLGIQYPPAWVFNLPDAHFVNQYGQPFLPAPGSGDCGVNLVFSEAARQHFEAYVREFFRDMGGDFYAVRLGGGRYGELGYPINKDGGQSNCYWAFDPVAQGAQPGLPEGQTVCPVPGWIPGVATPGHASARQFLDWYMASMRNYHDWQISMVRRYFSGPLFMLYPSTGGLRPGQLDAAVKDDANGSTGPEKTGEVGRGYDTSRFVAGITDPQVVVYTTWVDGFEGSDDAASDPRRWSPGHYLASLAKAHQPPLLTGGENTGHPDDLANMQLTFQRMHDERLVVLFWAFEPTLFDGKKPHASIDSLKQILSFQLR